VAWQSGRMLDEGVWAEIRVGGEHLRLFSERNAQGVQASVYNVIAKNWIAPSEDVGDIEEGKEKAAAYAEAYLKRVVNVELPSLLWRKARSALVGFGALSARNRQCPAAVSSVAACVLVELAARSGLIGAQTACGDFGLVVVFASDGAIREAAKQGQLADVAQGVGDGALEKLLGARVEGFVRGKVIVEFFNRVVKAVDFGGPG
jgi:hypothetical protein